MKNTFLSLSILLGIVLSQTGLAYDCTVVCSEKGNYKIKKLETNGGKDVFSACYLAAKNAAAGLEYLLKREGRSVGKLLERYPQGNFRYENADCWVQKLN